QSRGLTTAGRGPMSRRSSRPATSSSVRRRASRTHAESSSVDRIGEGSILGPMATRRSASVFALGMGAGLAAAVFGLLTLGERRRPLRRRVEDGGRHLRRNLALAAVSAAAVQIVDRPLTRRAAALAERPGWGVVPRLGLPRWVQGALAFLLLDYTLWVWHVLLHRWTPLWRFHAVHHADLDLDASTGVRFHPGELLASVPWRVAQVALIG